MLSNGSPEQATLVNGNGCANGTISHPSHTITYPDEPSSFDPSEMRNEVDQLSQQISYDQGNIIEFNNTVVSEH
uniref:Uncharacterized protein n=1 Tax=Heterorhabditis bacteriophora TaxID=37862 RepID=A0A1I7XQ38_HETBA